MFPNGSNKWTWLLSKLVEFTVCLYRNASHFVRLILSFSAGKVLIFVTRKDNCAELAKNLKENGFTGTDNHDQNIFTHLLYSSWSDSR